MRALNWLCAPCGGALLCCGFATCRMYSRLILAQTSQAGYIREPSRVDPGYRSRLAVCSLTNQVGKLAIAPRSKGCRRKPQNGSWQVSQRSAPQMLMLVCPSD